MSRGQPRLQGFAREDGGVCIILPISYIASVTFSYLVNTVCVFQTYCIHITQEGMLQLEKQMKKICTLCEERQALAEKDRQLFNGELSRVYIILVPTIA